jgi:peptidoglycan-associated lipoprotein
MIMLRGSLTMKLSRSLIIATTLMLCPVLFSGCRVFGGKKHGNSSEEEDLNIGNVEQGGYAREYREGLGHRVQNLNLDVIYFGYDSFQVEPSQTATVETVGDYMRDNPNAKLVVEGHCDERGSREYNLSLGEHRALAVRAYLIGLGIEASRIQTRSYGEEAPTSAGHDDTAWRDNRRGEFAVYE